MQHCASQRVYRILGIGKRAFCYKKPVEYVYRWRNKQYPLCAWHMGRIAVLLQQESIR